VSNREENRKKAAGQEESTGFMVDASALLAYLRGLPGAEIVERVLRQSAESGAKVKILATELLFAYDWVARNEPSMLDEVLALTVQLPLSVEPVTLDGIEKATRFLLSQPGISAENAALLAVAESYGVVLLTCQNELPEREGILRLGRERSQSPPAR